LVSGSERDVPGDPEWHGDRVRRVDGETAVDAARGDDVAAVLIADPTAASRRRILPRIAEEAAGTPVIAVVETRSEADEALIEAGATGIVTTETVPRLLGPDGPELLSRLRTNGSSPPVETASESTAAAGGTEAVTGGSGTNGASGRMLERVAGPMAADLDRYETIVNTVEDAIYLMDPDGQFVALNDAGEDLTGYSREYLVGRHVSTVLPDDAVDRGEELIRDLLDDETGHVGTVEQTVVTADGEEIPCENRLAIVESDGEFVGNVGVVRDLRERRERERRLREERALVEAIFESVPDLLYAFDENGEFLRWNDRVPEVTGYSDAEIEETNPVHFLAPEDRGRVKDALGTVVSDRRIERLELSLLTSDGERIPHEFSGGPVVSDDGELIGVAGMGRDVSDRVARERKIERQRDELDDLNRINAVIRDIDQALIRAQTREEAERAVCDRLAASEAYRFATLTDYDPATESFVPRTGAGDHGRVDVVERIGTAPDELACEAIRTRDVTVVENLRAGDRLQAWAAAAFECGVRSLAVIPVTFEDRAYGVLSVFAARPDAFDERETTVLGELGETLGYALDSIEREEREQLLTTLQASTRELINAASKPEVCDRVVDAVSNVLETAGVGVFLLDEDRGQLARTAATAGFTEQFPAERLPDPGADDSVAWSAFLDGETVVFDGSGPGSLVDGETGSGMAVPLGNHALLVAVSSDPTGFDGDLRHVLELFATSAEAALDRVEGEADLRARDAELESRNRRLERQVQINEVIRGVDEAVVDGTTRAEVEQSVCERLVSEGPYRFAWIGQFDPATDDLEPRTWAGDGGEYLDTLGADADEPGYRALDRTDPVIVPRVSDRLHDEPWRQRALSRGLRSVVAVPLTYENYTYGVLAVYADDSAAFGETERPVFAELGETIANAINGIETKQSLLGDEAVRLKLRLAEKTSPLVSLGRQLDSPIRLEGINTWTSDGLRAFVSIGGDPEAVVAALDGAVAIADYRPVGERDSEVYEIEFADGTVLGILLEHGGLPRDLTVEGGEMELIVDVSHDIHVRELVDAVRATHPTTELVARKDVTRELRSAEQLRSDVLADLTDRQREVLTTAHLSGYFERPRESTGQDIADTLGVSQPAVNRHLRVAQRTVFDWLLGDNAVESDALGR
jgi:PAS domain S-box-containing protein